MILTTEQAKKLLNDTWTYLEKDTSFTDTEGDYKTIADEILFFFNDQLGEEKYLSFYALENAEDNFKQLYNHGALNFTNKLAVLCGFILVKSRVITVQKFRDDYWNKESDNKKMPNRHRKELLIKYLSIKNGNNPTILESNSLSGETPNYEKVHKNYSKENIHLPYTLINKEYLEDIKNRHLQNPKEYNALNFYTKATSSEIQWWGHLNDCTEEISVQQDIIVHVIKGLYDGEAPVLVWIQGVGGMGKSTLLRTLTKDLVINRPITVAWVNAQRSLQDFFDDFKQNYSNYQGEVDIICIDQLDTDKELVVKWIKANEHTFKKIKIKLLIAGRPPQGIDHTLMYEGSESHKDLQKLRVPNDNTRLFEKAKQKIIKSATITFKEKWANLHPFILLFILRRIASNSDLIDSSFEDIIKQDLGLLDLKAEQVAQNEPNFRNSLIYLAGLYHNSKHNSFITKEAFLRITDHFSKSKALLNLKTKPIEKWGELSILSNYLSFCESPEDRSRGIVPEAIIFNHDDLAEEIYKQFVSVFEQKEVENYHFLIQESDNTTASRTLYHVVKYSKLFSNDETLTYIEQFVEKKNSHHSYMKLLFYEPLSSVISDDKRWDLLEKYFRITKSNHWLCSHVYNWLYTKDIDFKNKKIRIIVEDWQSEYYDFLKIYINFQTIDKQIIIVKEWLNKYKEAHFIKKCFDILGKQQEYKSLIIEHAQRLLEDGNTENISLGLKYLDIYLKDKKNLWNKTQKLLLKYQVGSRIFNQCLKILYIIPTDTYLEVEEIISDADLLDLTLSKEVLINKCKELLKDVQYARNGYIRNCLTFLNNCGTEKNYLLTKSQELIENREEPEIICTCLNILNKNGGDREYLTKEATKLLKNRKIFDIVCRCLDILDKRGNDNDRAFIIEKSRELLEESGNRGVIERSLNIMLKENKKLAKQYAQKVLDRKILPYSNDTVEFCEIIANIDGAADKKIQFILSENSIKYINQNNVDALTTAIYVLSDTAKVKTLITKIFTDRVWRNAELSRSLSYVKIADSIEWSNGIRHILKHSYLYRGRIIGNAMYKSDLFPSEVLYCCEKILTECSDFVERIIKFDATSYTGHIIKALAHPELKNLARKTAREMMNSDLSFFTEGKGLYLYNFAKDIVDNDIYPLWEDE